MKWKIYFWIYLLISLGGLILVIPHLFEPSFELYEGTIENIILVLGTWSYAYNKNIFHSAIWKYAFTIILIIWLLQLFVAVTGIEFLFFTKSNFLSGQIIFSIAISVPALIAIYRLGKGKFLK